MIYVGLDLTSAFSAAPRAIDGAVLADDLSVRFFQMQWPAAALVVQRDGAIFHQTILQAAGLVAAADIVLAVDGPQGLASVGTTMRHCERVLGTPGHTPAALPPPQNGGAVYMGGYIRSSLDFFAGLITVPNIRLAGLQGLQMQQANLFEVFPGAEWTVLAGHGLANKETGIGRQQRRNLLVIAGLQLPQGMGVPSADENDAAVGAYLAWCVRNAPLHVGMVGHAPVMTGADLREGFILHGNHLFGPTEAGGTTEAVPDAGPVGPTAAAAALGDWSDEECDRLLLIDDGLVHGDEPENAWLVAGTNYNCATVHPHAPTQFTLQHAPTFAGGRGWRMVPSVHRVRNLLGFAFPQYLSRANAITLRVTATAI